MWTGEERGPFVRRQASSSSCNLRPLVMNGLECSCASRTHVNLVPSHQSQWGATRPTATRCYRFRPNSTIIGCLRHAATVSHRPTVPRFKRAATMHYSHDQCNTFWLLCHFASEWVRWDKCTFCKYTVCCGIFTDCFFIFFLDVRYVSVYLFASPFHSCKVQNRSLISWWSLMLIWCYQHMLNGTLIGLMGIL